MKYEETKEEKYLKTMTELTPKITNLNKMAQDRDKEDNLKADNDIVYQINKKKLERQKLNDIARLGKKHKREDHKTDASKNAMSQEELFYSLTPKERYDRKFKNVNELKKQLDYYGNELEILFQKKNEIESQKTKKREDIFFEILGIDITKLSQLVIQHNKKFNKEEYKIVNLDTLDY